MFRSRDLVAILLAAWLIRLAWNDDQESLSANFHLAFYTHATVYSDLDIDGDGTTEALAIVERSPEPAKWLVEILDLKPLHHNNAALAPKPFRPKTMLQATAIESFAKPIAITTGQTILQHHLRPKKIKTSTASSTKFETTDRTRHYFCGNDWSDAAQRCSSPCPGGTPGECPGDEKCYADTPCDAMAEHEDEDISVDASEFVTTPAGGLPSIVTLWSDGTVRMHAVTAYKKEQSRKKTELKLLELWNTQFVMDRLDNYTLTLLGDLDLSAGDDNDNSMGKHGVVVVGGTKHESSTVRTLDAMTGKILWNSNDLTKDEGGEEADQLVVSPRGTTSTARRRSRLVEAGEKSQQLILPNCWSSYRHSLMSKGLPFRFWGASDAKWEALHLDRTSRRYAKRAAKNKHRKWHHRHEKPIHARPNVLLSHYHGGINVRSLKNGRPICHLSLLDHVLYSDLNKDGTLDQMLVVTDGNQGDGKDNKRWIESLEKQMHRDAKQEKGKNAMSKKGPPRLCHVLAISGMPAREQLFSAGLCGDNMAKDRADHASITLASAPPLVTLHNQVVVAVSNGMVSKFHAPTGKRIWQHHAPQQDFITWSADSDVVTTASLFVAEAPYAPPPILLVGENGMQLLSDNTGKTLASTLFPQAARMRPLMTDITGDGTKDVIVPTPDAVWGYVIIVKTGASILFRILVGLLFVAIAMALLRNRFGQKSDKRSTDS